MTVIVSLVNQFSFLFSSVFSFIEILQAKRSSLFRPKFLLLLKSVLPAREDICLAGYCQSQHLGVFFPFADITEPV
jgi:hypothetical protein